MSESINPALVDALAFCNKAHQAASTASRKLAEAVAALRIAELNVIAQVAYDDPDVAKRMRKRLQTRNRKSNAAADIPFVE